MNTRPETFEQWQQLAQEINARGKALQDSLHDRGWALAASVGIDRNMCCLHNASIDESLSGWCFRNPERLKVARQAKHILDDWTASRLAEQIISRAWDHLAKLNGMAHS